MARVTKRLGKGKVLVSYKGKTFERKRRHVVGGKNKSTVISFVRIKNKRVVTSRRTFRR